MAKTSGNKVKAWRRNSPGNHLGRKLKHISAQNVIGGRGPVASEILVGMFERAGIRMPKAEAYRDMLNRLIADQQKAIETATPVVTATQEVVNGTE